MYLGFHMTGGGISWHVEQKPFHESHICPLWVYTLKCLKHNWHLASQNFSLWLVVFPRARWCLANQIRCIKWGQRGRAPFSPTYFTCVLLSGHSGSFKEYDKSVWILMYILLLLTTCLMLMLGFFLQQYVSLGSNHSNLLSITKGCLWV